MQTTDPRRTPRPDSEERTPKQGAAARPLPVNRRAPQRRGPNQSMLVFAAVLAVIVLHVWKRNNLLSIGAGTVFYMFLVQAVF